MTDPAIIRGLTRRRLLGAAGAGAVARSPLVFPSADSIRKSRYYYQFQNQDELDLWNSLFEPIPAGK